jgi:hypothetical protein
VDDTIEPPLFHRVVEGVQQINLYMFLLDFFYTLHMLGEYRGLE